MSERVVYWSVTVGARYAAIFAACVRSARTCGVKEEFHCFGDSAAAGAVWHQVRSGMDPLWLKVDCLRRLTEVPGDVFVFLDADTWFVRRPLGLVGLVEDAGVHVPCETDLRREAVRFEDWWGVPCGEIVAAADGLGLKGGWTCNAGLIVLRREAVATFHARWLDMIRFCAERGWQVTEELPLALAFGGVCHGAGHCVWRPGGEWVSDWAGRWCGRLPLPGVWVGEEYMTGRRAPISPAIVHAMRSKAALARHGGWAE